MTTRGANKGLRMQNGEVFGPAVQTWKSDRRVIPSGSGGRSLTIPREPDGLADLKIVPSFASVLRRFRIYGRSRPPVAPR